MRSTRFETQGSSSGRRLCIQLWYGTFYMRRYKQSSFNDCTFCYNIWLHYFCANSLLCSCIRTFVLSVWAVHALKRYSSPVTGLEWPRGFQEVKVPTFHDNGTGRW